MVCLLKLKMLIIILTLLCVKMKANNTRNLFVFFRHGEAVPGHSVLSHISPFPQSPNQLTQLGMNQIFSLGQNIRKYVEVSFPIPIDETKFHIQSSSYDRALMSAHVMAAGFFSPQKDSPLPIEWKPVAVHSKLMEEDVIFANYNCEKFYELLDNDLKTKQVKDFIAKHMTTLNLINEKLQTSLKMQDMKKLEDDIIAYRENKLPLPDWLTNPIVTEVVEIAQFFRSIAISTRDRIIYEVGYVADYFINHIQEFARTGSTSSPKMNGPHLMAFSGHDINLQSLLAMFNVTMGPTNFGSAVVFQVTGFRGFPGPLKNYEFSLGYMEHPEKDVELLELEFCHKKLSCRLDLTLDYLKGFAVNMDQYIEKCKL